MTRHLCPDLRYMWLHIRAFDTSYRWVLGAQDRQTPALAAAQGLVKLVVVWRVD